MLSVAHIFACIRRCSGSLHAVSVVLLCTVLVTRCVTTTAAVHTAYNHTRIHRRTNTVYTMMHTAIHCGVLLLTILHILRLLYLQMHR
jgi:hypothetical protein